MPTEPDNERRTSATTAAAIQAQLLLDQCHDLISERDYQGAAAADQQAIKLVPDQPDPYIALVEARVGMGSHQRAVEACSEAYRRTSPTTDMKSSKAGPATDTKLATASAPSMTSPR